MPPRGLRHYLTTPQLHEIISQAFTANSKAVGLAILFGFVWGFGNVTYGMANRYLGIALGGSIAVGFCMLFGTLIPPIFEGTAEKLLRTTTGQVVLGGILLCGFGIALCGLAGRRRELELSSTASSETNEFRLGLGLFVAVLAGVLSACFSFGLRCWQANRRYFRAKWNGPTLFQQRGAHRRADRRIFEQCALLPGNEFKKPHVGRLCAPNRTYLPNALLAWLSGVTWFCQFFFFGMGQTKLGKQFDFSSWSIHMAFIVVFLNLWGLAFHEWRGTTQKTKVLVWIGIHDLDWLDHRDWLRQLSE